MSHDPLRDVALSPGKAKGVHASLSPEQIDNLNAAQHDARAAEAAASPEAEEEKFEEVKPEDLSAEDIKALTEMRQLLMTSESLALQDSMERVQVAKRLAERNRKISENLPPLSLGELLMNDFIAIKIRISEDYDVTFRTVSNSVTVDASEVAREMMANAPKTASMIVNVTYMISIAKLACGLVEISGAPLQAQEIHQFEDSEVKERRDKIRETMHRLRKFPDELLEDLISLQTMFTAHVRKGIQTNGFVDSEVGKS